MINETFGRLRVIEDLGICRTPTPSKPQGRGARWVKCFCSCGKKIEVRYSSLKCGNTGSCGCLQREAIVKASTTHGKSKESVYRRYKTMIARCYNPNSQKFPDYGARGINVCERWRNSFEAFFEDMGEPPKGTTIDRVDNDRGYFPDNCRWATPQEQSENRRNARVITIKGKRVKLTDALRDMNPLSISQGLAGDRYKRGWPGDKIFSAPRMEQYA